MNTNHEFVGNCPIQESMEQLIIELVRAGLIDIEADSTRFRLPHD